jgi:hypothetical protein
MGILTSVTGRLLNMCWVVEFSKLSLSINFTAEFFDMVDLVGGGPKPRYVPISEIFLVVDIT